MQPKSLVLALASALLAAACATRLGEPVVSARAGWIIALEAPDALPACAVDASQRYVRVRYWQGHRALVEVAAVPEGLHPQVGEQVRIWPRDCASGSLSRIEGME